ncbi:Dyp-type peroxidase, partial [Bacillus sp. S34]|nr:Dyp-type peroxidase [Bacillus sp. S34]
AVGEARTDRVEEHIACRDRRAAPDHDVGAVEEFDDVGQRRAECRSPGRDDARVDNRRIFDERFGLASKKPAHLAAIPTLPSDNLDEGLTGGDLSLQACADDPQVAYHAVRDLARMARGTATVRWTVLGFGRASAGPNQSTPRNLM